MEKDLPVDIAQEWFLDEIRKNPEHLDLMSDDDLDKATNSLGIDVTPLVEFVHNFNKHDDNLTQKSQSIETTDDVLRRVEELCQSTIEG